MTKERTAPPEPAVVAEDLLARLQAQADAQNVSGMARFGISSEGTLGVPMPAIRALAREARRVLVRDPAAMHSTASLLWDSRVHEARILAALVDDPALVDAEQMERWVAGFDSWDVCDQVCANLFDKTDLAWEKAVAWADRDEEFVRRAAFALMAALAWHDKTASDPAFERFLPVIARAAKDERNFVKKAVSWALRQIGKRSPGLNLRAVATAEDIATSHPGSKAARWVARDALRELESGAVRARLGR